MFQILKGIRPFTQISSLQGLKMDGANDYVLINDDVFYNFGVGPFAVFVDITVRRGSTDVWFSKNKANVNGYFAQVDSDYVSWGLFAPGLLRYTVERKIVPGERIRVLFQRIGTNDAPSSDVANWPNSNRNRNNYEVYVNGSPKLPIRVGQSPMPAEIPTSNADTTNPLAFGATADGLVPTFGYFHTSAIYAKALSAFEREEIFSGNFPTEALRGLWRYASANGRQILDSSSVAKHGVLSVGYTDAEAGLPDPNTNRIWITGAVIVFNTGETVKTFTASFNTTLRKVVISTADTVHYRKRDATGAIVFDYQPLTFSAGVASDLNVPLLAGEHIDFSCGGTPFLEVFVDLAQ